jgi:hypothetical protein
MDYGILSSMISKMLLNGLVVGDINTHKHENKYVSNNTMGWWYGFQVF